MLPITSTILRVIREFTTEGVCSASEINSGLCVEFAEEVVDRLGGETDDLFLLTTDMFYSDFPEDFDNDDFDIETEYGGLWSKRMLNLYGYPPVDIRALHVGHHQWIYYNGKHYDSESPYGVKTPWQLKFFKRQISQFISSQ